MHNQTQFSLNTIINLLHMTIKEITNQNKSMVLLESIFKGDDEREECVIANWKGTRVIENYVS